MELMPEETLEAAAACLKTVAHPLRLRIVEVLLQGDVSVRELAAICGVPEHQACGHLRLMQASGLLDSERRGRTVHYRVVSPHLPGLVACIRENCPKGRALEDQGETS
jgi:ArsR family transcriptional regulator, zinc-responsive transcriptional repressor